LQSEIYVYTKILLEISVKETFVYLKFVLTYIIILIMFQVICFSCTIFLNFQIAIFLYVDIRV